MTGFKFLARPLVDSSPVPTFRDAMQRHARVVGGVDPVTRYVGGYAGAGENTRLNGSTALAPYGSLEQWWGCTVDGHGVEWDMGLLECDRDWTISFHFWQNTGNAQVGIYMNDVLLGATIEQYAAAQTPNQTTRTWSPAAGLGRINHRLALKVTGKNNASSGRVVSCGGLVLSRTVGNADRTL